MYALLKKLVPLNFGMIPIEFVCQKFKINLESQINKIHSNSFFEGAFFNTSNEFDFNDGQKHWHLYSEAFIRWILKLDLAEIGDDKTLFLGFQDACIEYFETHDVL